MFFFNGGGDYPDTYSFSLMKEDASGRITTITTLLLYDFYDSRTPFLVASRDLLYFVGRPSQDKGHALFRTAGTSASTQLVADTYVAGGQSSDPTQFLKIGDAIFFIAREGRERTNLWKTDGTNAGTIGLTELHNAGALTDVNGQLFFVGVTSGSDDAGWAIYKTDGTPGGESKIPFEFEGLPQSLTNVNGKLFVTWGTNHIMTTDGSGYSLSVL